MQEYTQVGVKIIVDKPPVWNNVCMAFNIIPKHVLFAYADTIYNPENDNIPDYLVEHEKIHFRQQKTFCKTNTKTGAALWWGKYLRDPEFRYKEEVIAYAHQYNEMKKVITDRNKRVKILYDLSKILTGPLYNNIGDRVEAENAIRSTADVLQKHSLDYFFENIYVKM